MANVQRGSVLVAADAGSGDSFGTSVALSDDGTVLAVGATHWDSAADQGGVYIYDWSGGAWVQRGSVLVAADAGSTDWFGLSVALSADGAVLAVGATQWDSVTDQGGVYIYDWSGGAWVQRGSVLVAADAGANDWFGRAVALSDDGTILAVGASHWDGLASNQGGIYIYDWSGGAWVQRGSVLTAADYALSDFFGRGVALSADGTILAVGAIAWEGPAEDQGGVYIYDWSGGAWVQRGSVLVAADAETLDAFGTSVALSDDGTVLAVGATQWDAASSNQGGVYIYDWTGGAWVQRGSVLVAADADLTDYFGSAVALSSDGAIVAVGANQWEGPAANQGGVYIYDVITIGELKGVLSSGGTVSGTIGSLLAGVLSGGGVLSGALDLNTFDFVDEVGAADSDASWMLTSYSLAQTAAITSTIAATFGLQVTEAAGSSDNLADSTFTMYIETIGLADSLALSANTRASLADSAVLIGTIQQAINQIVADSADGADSMSLGAALTLVDIADAVETQAPTYNSVMLVAELIATLEAYNGADGYDIAESGALSDAYVARVEALVAVLEAAQAVDTNTALIHVMQLATDSAAGATAITSTGSVLTALLSDSVLATIRINIGGELFTGWVLNTDTMAPSEYQFADRQFNSACKHGARYLMAADDGIYEFTDDAGVESVMTYIKTGKTDFGSDLKKRIVNSYMVYSASGQMVLKVTTSEFGNLVTRNYRMTPQADDTTDARRIDIGRGVKSRYWQFEVVGDGVDCAIDEIGMLPIVLSRRL